MLSGLEDEMLGEYWNPHPFLSDVKRKTQESMLLWFSTFRAVLDKRLLKS